MKTNHSNGQLTAQVDLGNQQKSGFDLSNNVLGTGKLGRIYPTRALHVMPNDSLNNKTEVAVQFEPLAVPMLANMYVRQEHFYCPYNIVWKNWDKFISGGEKLDYKGVVPNVTMQRIVDVMVTNLIGSTNKIGFKAVYGDVAPAGFGTYYRIDDLPINKLETYCNSLLGKLRIAGEAFGIADILDEQREAIDNLNVFIDKFRDLGALNTAFDSALFINFNETDWNSFGEMWHAYEEQYHLTGSKYLESLKVWAEEKFGNDLFVFLPTSLGLDFLICIYDYVKSFIGVGSIIDYLNMARMTFTDYLYIWLSSLKPISSSQALPNPYDFSSNGFPTNFSTEPLSILHLRANYSVWYNNYRDVLLETIPLEPTDTDTITDDELFTLLVPRQRCWNKDAFTTALDNPGTGNASVVVDAGTSVTGWYSVKEVSKFQEIDGYPSSLTPDGNNLVEITIDGKPFRLPTAYLHGVTPITDEQKSVSGFSLYALDAAQRAQKWLQKALFFGNRISDFYYMRFGVRYLDARLHLPELLASSTQLVKLDVVMNNTNITTEAGGEIYQSVAGDRSAYASAFDNGDGYNRFCEEHGVVLSYLTIMPQPTYAYGRSRDYSRLDQFDFAFSEFATLGMDAVYDTEITSVPFDRETKIFGYQGRYYDYKAKHSEEHGELLESQDMYTFGRRFDMYSEEGAPKLNYAFVHCFPPLDMFVVDSKLADYFRFDMRHNTTCERLLPAQSIYI